MESYNCLHFARKGGYPIIQLHIYLFSSLRLRASPPGATDPRFPPVLSYSLQHNITDMPRAYRSRVQAASRSRKGGQGLDTLSFSGERSVVRKQWMKSGASNLVNYQNSSDSPKIARKDGVQLNCVLSQRAKGIIRAELQKGTYAGREKATEPAFMAPDPNPAEYSQVVTHSRISSNGKR